LVYLYSIEICFVSRNKNMNRLLDMVRNVSRSIICQHKLKKNMKLSIFSKLTHPTSDWKIFFNYEYTKNSQFLSIISDLFLPRNFSQYNPFPRSVLIHKNTTASVIVHSRTIIQWYAAFGYMVYSFDFSLRQNCC